MASIDYDDIFASFLGSIEDTKLFSLEASDANIIMTEYLQKALSKPYVTKLFSSIYMDGVSQAVMFEMAIPTDESSDLFFVRDILSKCMVVEWLSPIVNKTSLLKQMITSSKESKFFSQASHLTELKSLLKDTRIDMEKQILDRDMMYNAYLGDNR